MPTYGYRCSNCGHEFEIQQKITDQPLKPCRMIAPIVEQLHGELGDKVSVVKMDIDENPATPMALGIMSIPTVIIFKDGKPAERTVGYRPNMKGDLKAKLEALI